MEKHINPWSLKIFPYTTILEPVCMAAFTAAALIGVFVLGLDNETGDISDFFEAGFAASQVIVRAVSYVLAVYCIYGLLEFSPRMEVSWYTYIVCILVRSLNRLVEGIHISVGETGSEVLKANLLYVNWITTIAGNLLHACAFYVALRVFADNLGMLGQQDKEIQCRRLAKNYLILEIVANGVDIIYMIFEGLAGSPSGEPAVTSLKLVVIFIFTASDILIFFTRIVLFFVLRKSCRMLYTTIVYRADERGGAE